MRRIFECTSTLVLLLGISAAQTQPGQAAREVLIRANNRAAVQLLKAAAEEEREHSVVIPAFSASSVLWLLGNGASPEGQEDLQKVFGKIELDLGQINEGAAALQTAVTKPAVTPKPKVRSGPAPVAEYAPALAIWSTPADLTPAWTRTAARYYHADRFRFPSHKAAALKAVNSWLAKAAGSAYTEVVGRKELIDADFLITTASRFRGRWLIEFDVARTKPQPFHRGNGSMRNLPFMERFDEHFSYFEGDSFQSIGLPYHDSEMFIFLPAESSSLHDLIGKLTPESLEAWSDAIEKNRHAGRLQLPRFKTESAVDLRATMEKLGATTLFRSFGSLRPMVNNIPEGARLVSIRQLSAISVNEKETVVQTKGMMGGVIGGVCANCPPSPPPFRMIVNRPFLFVVRDSRTKLILYIAAVNDPVEGEAPN